MSYDSLLIHTCTIQRSSTASTDEFGQPVLTWSDHEDDVPCRYYPIRGREVDTVQKHTVVASHILHMRKWDVREGDRIVDIYEGAVELDAGPFDILRVKRRANSVVGHHLELEMKRVSDRSYEDIGA